MVPKGELGSAGGVCIPALLPTCWEGKWPLLSAQHSKFSTENPMSRRSLRAGHMGWLVTLGLGGQPVYPLSSPGCPPSVKGCPQQSLPTGVSWGPSGRCREITLSCAWAPAKHPRSLISPPLLLWGCLDEAGNCSISYEFCNPLSTFYKIPYVGLKGHFVGELAPSWHQDCPTNVLISLFALFNVIQ